VLDRALAQVEFLRASCAWDAQQTPVSLVPFLLEEAHEVAEAVHQSDDAALRDEVGDLLLNVAFQIVLAEERGAWSREEVVAGLEQKMRRRHPHLYGEGEAEPWDAIKARERSARPQTGGTLDPIPSGADPLLRAHRVQQAVAAVGFDWADAHGALRKVVEETREVAAELGGSDPGALEEELGDLLFAAVNLVRLAGSHPSAALGRANAKFERRFRRLEAAAEQSGLHLGEAALEQLDAIWEDIKRAERAEDGP
jgi:MazG family protein